MKHLAALLLIALLAACNLTTQPVAVAPTSTATLEPTATFALPPSVTPLTIGSKPTLAPPPVAFDATLPPGSTCQVYTTYSGSDPDNLLSLRAAPTVTARQILKLPNHSRVYRVPNSQEIEADGYHWLNIIYIDDVKNRFRGWTARDSFESDGIRNTLVATLRETSEQASC